METVAAALATKMIKRKRGKQSSDVGAGDDVNRAKQAIRREKERERERERERNELNLPKKRKRKRETFLEQKKKSDC